LPPCHQCPVYTAPRHAQTSADAPVTCLRRLVKRQTCDQLCSANVITGRKTRQVAAKPTRLQSEVM
jgi:hypothetical protein